MADSDDASRRRASHYNQQRSSLQSRPVSGQLARAYSPSDRRDDLDHVSPPQTPDADIADGASPAPNVPRVPRRKHSLDQQRTRSRSAVERSPVEELLFPHGDAGLDEAAVPAPVQNPGGSPRYHHHTLEEQRSAARSRTQHPAHHPWATELYTVSYLVFFSIFGTLARLGVQWLTFYPGAPSTFPVLWANFGGTLFMGFLSQDRRLFRQEWGHAAPTPPRKPLSDQDKAREQGNRAASHAKVKKTIPLYIGLATGFCGSFTSFSSFLRDVFLAFLNDLPYPNADVTAGRNDGYSVMAGLAVIIITIAACYSALKAGAHGALLLDRFTPTLPFRFTRAIIDPAIAFIAWGVWLGAIFMAIWPPDRHAANETWRGQAIFACVFGPLGCLLRFYASLKLNPISPSFPLGTFAVNIFGTAVLGMAWDLQHIHLRGSGVGGGRVGCQVLQGTMDGFDGCLTTVSTWILEIDTLKTNHAWKYAFASVAAGICVLVVVMGSVRWSVGWTETACVTTRSW